MYDYNISVIEAGVFGPCFGGLRPIHFKIVYGGTMSACKKTKQKGMS